MRWNARKMPEHLPQIEYHNVCQQTAVGQMECQKDCLSGRIPDKQPEESQIYIFNICMHINKPTDARMPDRMP